VHARENARAWFFHIKQILVHKYATCGGNNSVCRPADNHGDSKHAGGAEYGKSLVQE
ncbi:unnamed protein product, partial [Ectocarpus sp. 6 AP-2014]